MLTSELSFLLQEWHGHKSRKSTLVLQLSTGACLLVIVAHKTDKPSTCVNWSESVQCVSMHKLQLLLELLWWYLIIGNWAHRLVSRCDSTRFDLGCVLFQWWHTTECCSSAQSLDMMIWHASMHMSELHLCWRCWLNLKLHDFFHHNCMLNHTLAPWAKTDRVMSICVLVERCVGYVSQSRALKSIHYSSFYNETIPCIAFQSNFAQNVHEVRIDATSDTEQM